MILTVIMYDVGIFFKEILTDLLWSAVMCFTGLLNFVLAFADPTVFSGHTSGIRHVIFFRGDTHLVTCADDRTLRVWDRTSGQVHTCYMWAAVRLYPGQVL